VYATQALADLEDLSSEGDFMMMETEKPSPGTLTPESTICSTERFMLIAAIE